MDNNINKKFFVVKDNNLIEAYIEDLSAVEHKILLTAISKVKPGDKILETSFTVKSFCKLLKINKVGMYTYIKSSCDKLLKRTITLSNGNNWVKFPWIYRIEYYNGLIKIHFHHDLEPYLLFRQKNKYTKYLLENIIDMNSKYSIRIYELLKQYEKIGYRELKIDEFKKFLGLSIKKYKKYNDFKKKVLEISREEINGLTDINIYFEEIKEGRKIAKIRYIITAKNYNMNTTQYELFPKLKLISILQRMIHERTGYVFVFKKLNMYHRIVLIELIKKFDNSSFNDVLIQYPNAFFKWHLDDISNNYDLNKIEDP